jgi:hypothetical protein
VRHQAADARLCQRVVLTLKGAPACRPSGEWSDDDYDVGSVPPESESGRRPPGAFPRMSVAIPVRVVTGTLLLIG